MSTPQFAPRARMRLGLLSDVHGNLAGLNAVAAALALEGQLDAVVVAGDHVQGGPRPREVWQFLLRSGWSLILGNEDEAFVHPDRATRTAPEYEHAYRAQLQWGRDVLGAAALAELAALPFSRRLPTPAGDLLVVHSSPHDADDRRGGVENSAEDAEAAYAGTGATAIAFGHYHRSFVRPTPFALLVNVASVGLPLDGQPLAAYTILTATTSGWIVEQRRVPYDVADEDAARVASGMPPWEPTFAM